jgi:ABC-type multidrug transport system ATPase subunit
MLKIQDVSVFSNGKFILKSVSIDVQPKTLVCIVGLSGVGKSTLLEIMAGVTTPSCGIVQDGPVQEGSFAKVFLAADAPECSTETVHEWLTHSRRSRPGTTLQMESEVDDVIQQLGLSDCANSYMNGVADQTRLSSGELKRVGIANALLLDPSVLIADELTSGLSDADVLKLMPVMRRYVQDSLAGPDKSIICTIHQGSAACMAFFDRTIVLAEGAVVFDGNLSDLYSHFSVLTNSEVLSLESFDTAVDWALWHLAEGKHHIKNAKWDIAELVFKAREARFFNDVQEAYVADQTIARTTSVSVWRQFELCFLRLWRAQVRSVKSVFSVTIIMGVLLLGCFMMINAKIPQRDEMSRAFGELNVIYVSTFMESTAVRLHVPTLTALYVVFKREIRQRMYSSTVLLIACAVCWLFQWILVSVMVCLVIATVLPPYTMSEAVIAVSLLTMEVLIHATVLDTLAYSGVRRRYVDACLCLFDTVCWMSAGNVSGYAGMTTVGRFLYKISPTALTFAGLIRNRFGEDISTVSMFLDVRPEPSMYFLTQIGVYLVCLRLVSAVIIATTMNHPDRVFTRISRLKLESMQMEYLLGHGDSISKV